MGFLLSSTRGLMDTFSILPTEITWDIFARLPIESVLNCKLVSKIWRDLIQHSLFYKMHFNRHTRYADSGKLGFLALATDRKQLYYFEYIENHDRPIDKITKFQITPPFKNSYTFVGSVNGLICIRDRYDSDRFNISNPMTKEYVILPQPKIGFRQHHCWSCGFGYISSTNEYKVVALHKDLNSVEAVVYTIGSSNGWKNTGKLYSRISHVSCKDAGVLLNGALYWGHNGRDKIIVFDLTNETFGEQLPPTSNQVCHSANDTIGVLGGQLFYAKKSYSLQNDQTSYDIRLSEDRKDNLDIREHHKQYQPLRWTEEFRLPTRLLLALTENRGILSYSFKHIKIYNPKESTWDIVASFGGGFREVFPHQNTFLSLKELGEEDVQIME